MPRRSTASAALLAACGLALLGGCHWIIEHQPHQAGLEAGAPPAADLVRPRREHRPAPEASSLDAAPALDLPLPSPDSTANPTTLFSDDFSQAGGGLVDDGVGTWSVADGVYRQTTCKGIPESAVPGKSWGDVTARVRVRADQLCYELGIFPKMNEAGLIVRVASYAPAGCTNNRYYYCVLDFFSSELFVGERKASADCTGSDTPLQLPKLSTGTRYELELTAKGNRLDCRVNVNGTWLSATWTDSSTSAIAQGSAGLLADELRVSFDDFLVLGL